MAVDDTPDPLEGVDEDVELGADSPEPPPDVEAAPDDPEDSDDEDPLDSAAFPSAPFASAAFVPGLADARLSVL